MKSPYPKRVRPTTIIAIWVGMLILNALIWLGAIYATVKVVKWAW